MEVSILKLKQILSKPTISRDTTDLKIIASQVANVKFFESLREYKSVFKETCTFLTYEFYQKNEFVFNEGEYGDRFYILLKGEAGVIVTIKEKDRSYQKEVFVYKDGSSFGELALINSKPRSASILAKTDCHFAALDKGNYNRLLASQMKQKRNDLVEFLQTQVLFQNWTKGSILKISYCFEEKILKKNQFVFKEGDKVEHLYIVRKGEVKLSRNLKINIIENNEPMTRGTFHLKKFMKHRADLGILGLGEILGLSDADSEHYSATCKCLSTVVVLLMISARDFNKKLSTEESREVINTGRFLRESIHEESITSITKIVKDRLISPYKRIFMNETLNTRLTSEPERTKLQLKAKRLIAEPSVRNTESPSQLSTNDNMLATYDLRVFKGKNRKMYMTQNPSISSNRPFSVGKPRKMTLEQRPKTSAVINESLSSKKPTGRTPSIQLESTKKKRDTNCKDSTETFIIRNKIAQQEKNLSFMVTSLEPFGRNRRNRPSIKMEEEVVNIHIAHRKKSDRNRNPTNWSFRTLKTSPKKAWMTRDQSEKSLA
jgi:CRP-like cAMP-binding protein